MCAAFSVRRTPKPKAGAPMGKRPYRTLASLWIAEHPEYHADLADVDAAIARNYDETPAQTNPSCTCQCTCRSASNAASTSRAASVRQSNCWPSGLDSLHDAHHAAMECLGEMLWKANAPAARPTAMPTSPPCSAALRGTDFAQRIAAMNSRYE